MTLYAPLVAHAYVGGDRHKENLARGYPTHCRYHFEATKLDSSAKENTISVKVSIRDVLSRWYLMWETPICAPCEVL